MSNNYCFTKYNHTIIKSASITSKEGYVYFLGIGTSYEKNYVGYNTYFIEGFDLSTIYESDYMKEQISFLENHKLNNEPDLTNEEREYYKNRLVPHGDNDLRYAPKDVYDDLKNLQYFLNEKQFNKKITLNDLKDLTLSVITKNEIVELFNKVIDNGHNGIQYEINRKIKNVNNTNYEIVYMLEDNKITLEEASYLLKFNHFSNPLFVIGTVGTLMLNNKSIGILILIVHILSNFIVAMIYRPKYNTYQNSKSSLVTGIYSMHKKRIESSTTFASFLTESIFKIFQTLLLLLGIITSFLIITTLLKRVLNLDSMTFSLFSGLLEMTQGIKNISLLDISLNIKASIITFFISFGGFSIHMQVMSILSNYKIKYFPYLLARVVHASMASSIIFIILTFIN